MLLPQLVVCGVLQHLGHREEIALRANETIKYEFILRSVLPEFASHAECHHLGPRSEADRQSHAHELSQARHHPHNTVKGIAKPESPFLPRPGLANASL